MPSETKFADEEEQGDESKCESIYTDVQSQNLGNGTQSAENESLNSAHHLLSTQGGGSDLAGTLEELDTGWVTVEGKEGKKRYKLSSEEIDYRKAQQPQQPQRESLKVLEGNVVTSIPNPFYKQPKTRSAFRKAVAITGALRRG